MDIAFIINLIVIFSHVLNHFVPASWLKVAVTAVIALNICLHCLKVSAVQCRTVQYSCNTLQYSTVQYSAVQWSVVQCSTVKYRTVQYSAVQSICPVRPRPVTSRHTAAPATPPPLHCTPSNTGAMHCWSLLHNFIASLKGEQII